MIFKPFNFYIVTIFTICFNTSLYSSTNDSINPHPKEFIRAIERFNNNCIKDTLFCKEISPNCWLPERIKWAKIDTNICTNTIPDSLNKDSTIFCYPRSGIFTGSFFITDINGDSISDIMLKFRYFRIDSTSNIDSTRFICIFGQDSLTKIDTLKIFNIDSVQNNPFIARDIMLGRGLSDLKVFHPFNYSSYQLNNIQFTIQNRIILPPNQIMAVDDNINFALKEIMIPNPSSGRLEIKLSSNSFGNYKLNIFDNLGIQCVSSELIKTQLEQSYVLDVSNLSNGVYTVIIFNGNKIEAIDRFIKIN